MKLPFDNFDDVKKLPTQLFNDLMRMDMTHLSFATRMNILVGNGILTLDAAESALQLHNQHKQAIQDYWFEETA